VGEAFARETSVIIAKVDADAHKELGSRFGVSGFPTLKYFPKGETKNPEDYNGGRTAEDIVSFVNGKAGTNARVKKTPSYVVDLTPANFDKYVLDDKKSVFIEFYAPWCGHCKTLAPKWEKLAAAFVNEPDVVIAKVDADAHKELGTKYGVNGFPTLKWFDVKDKANPEGYEGGRELSDLVTYVNNEIGSYRGEDGRLTGKAGVVEDLAAIAAKFLEAAETERADLTQKATDIVAKLEGKTKGYGEVFSKLLSLVTKKGNTFVATELARVEKLLSGAISAAKADELSIRKNLLSTFKAAAQAAADAVTPEASS